MKADSLKNVALDVVGCNRCARLREYCQVVAREKRRAFVNWAYWGRPVPAFGDPNGRIWIVGLAPAAHGANRTGRMFTGDRSGDFLFAALHRTGLANQPHSMHRDDGLALSDVYISATARCAPPGNKPLPDEIVNCSEYLDREWHLLKNKRVMLALGKIGWDAALTLARRNGCNVAGKKISFGHGVRLRLGPALWLVGSYHVSQQNTFTGRLTTTMFDEIMSTCLSLAGAINPVTI